MPRRYLASATVGPDDTVADLLEASAERSRLRGGHAAASAAMARAADLTPDASSADHRLVVAAADVWTAGRGHLIPVLLRRADPLIARDADRADADYYRGLAEAARGDRRMAYDVLLTAAGRLADLDRPRAARLLVQAGRVAWQDADLPGVIEIGTRLEDLGLQQPAGEGIAAPVIVALGRLLRGDAAHAAARLREAASAADPDDPAQLHMAAVAYMFTGDDRIARELLVCSIARARALGAAVALPQSLATLASLEVWQGRYAAARAHAEESIALARGTGEEHPVAQLPALLAWTAAVQGRAQDCASLAADAIAVAEAGRIRQPVAFATWALALSDLGTGRWSDAMTRLELLADRHSATYHPIVGLMSAADLVEAAIRTDRLDLALDTVTTLADFVRPGTSTWTLALLARCRALVTNGTTAAAHFGEALHLHAGADRRLDEGRTHLLYGEFLRRRRQRGAARRQSHTALGVFESLETAPWEERARAELRATGETIRRREVGPLTELTPQQLQILRLVADGATNKEVAAQLFLSPRTVDYHLRNVFVKQGITSRTELVRHPQLREAARA